MRNYFNVLSAVVCVLSASVAWSAIPGKENFFLKRTKKAKSTFSISFFNNQNEQAVDRADWFNSDSLVDSIEGVSSDVAYSRYSLDPNAEDIVVAVIDSGVDVHHEDLVGKIWINAGEQGLDSAGLDKASNGVDDDANGYVDDIYGWNYIGGHDAEGKATHINYETLEMTRIYKRLSDKKAQEALTEEEEALFEVVSTAINTERDVSTARTAQVNEVKNRLKVYFALIANKVSFSFEELTLERAQALPEEDPVVADQKKNIIATFEEIKRDSVEILDLILAYHKQVLEIFLNPDFDPRSEIVGDNPTDFSDTDYGNNDVIGPDADHGTHVAGIIAANRDNALGIRGIAQNVKIMALRVVPNGDERDKDVALSIRYAVDNGAKVINMSFGKAFSPEQVGVQSAIRYAADHGVLLVHAAGNDAKDNDVAPSFPNRVLEDGSLASTWLDIGASASPRDETMVADFSNYGDQTVDIFAPGYEMESTIPGNQYAIYSGTSMASPAVAGVAALILGYSPELGGVELKELILDSGRLYPDLEVTLPGSQDLVPFSTLSMTGAVANALLALEQLFN